MAEPVVSESSHARLLLRRRRVGRLILCLGLSVVTVLTPSGVASADATGGDAGVIGSQHDPSGFYRNPSAAELAGTPVGGVFKFERMKVALPVHLASSQAWRIMYRSEGIHGRPIAVTGYVLVPRGTAPRGGWPMVAWGHGTSGLGPECAPSKDPDLQGYVGLHTRLLRDGYAVVATDYPGLGLPGQLHNWFQLYTLGRSVVDSVRAARNVSPALGRRWFVAGHSEGGLSALGAGELAAGRAPELDLLGTVPIATGSTLIPIVENLAASPHMPSAPEMAAYVSYAAVAAKMFAPQHIRYTDLLSPEFAAHLPAIKELCLGKLIKYLKKRKSVIKSWVNPDWARNQTLLRWFRSIYPAQRPSAAPMLVQQGSADTTVPQSRTNQLVADLCTLGDVVDYRTYRGLDHLSIIPATPWQSHRPYEDMSDWLGTRLAGQAARQTCQPVVDLDDFNVGEG